MNMKMRAAAVAAGKTEIENRKKPKTKIKRRIMQNKRMQKKTSWLATVHGEESAMPKVAAATMKVSQHGWDRETYISHVHCHRHFGVWSTFSLLRDSIALTLNGPSHPHKNASILVCQRPQQPKRRISLNAIKMFEIFDYILSISSFGQPQLPSANGWFSMARRSQVIIALVRVWLSSGPGPWWLIVDTFVDNQIDWYAMDHHQSSHDGQSMRRAKFQQQSKCHCRGCLLFGRGPLLYPESYVCYFHTVRPFPSIHRDFPLLNCPK